MRIAPATALVALLFPLTAAAQYGGGGTRALEEHTLSDNEGRLLAYYSALLTYSPVGAPITARPWAFEVGLEGGYVPRLSEQQRTAGRDKPETTNLLAVLPRPRAAIWLPGGLRVEGSWIPPISMSDVTANLVSVAAAYPVHATGALTLTPRVSYTGGRIRGPITCNKDLGNTTNQAFTIYYALVCHSLESDDHFEPRQWAGELSLTGPQWRGMFVPYGGLGVQHEDTRFDIGVRNADGSRDLDHPILELHTTRGYGFAGATWTAARLVRISGELFYAPGSVFTVRLGAALHFAEH